MNAIELTAPDLNAFRRTDLPTPRPGPGQVVLRLRAASLNYLDVAVATGAFPVPSWPMVPVADGAGEVAALSPCAGGHDHRWDGGHGDRL